VSSFDARYFESGLIARLSRLASSRSDANVHVFRVQFHAGLPLPNFDVRARSHSAKFYVHDIKKKERLKNVAYNGTYRPAAISLSENRFIHRTCSSPTYTVYMYCRPIQPR